MDHGSLTRLAASHWFLAWFANPQKHRAGHTSASKKRDSAQHWTMPIGKFILVFVASLSEVSSPDLSTDLSTIGWSLHNADADLMVSDFATSDRKRPMTSHVSTSHSHKSSNWSKLDFGISEKGNIQGHQSSLANLRCSCWKKQLVFTRKVRVSGTVLW